MTAPRWTRENTGTPPAAASRHLAAVRHVALDMAMARRTGAVGVLVLTGETQAHQVLDSDSPMDVVVSGLRELGEGLRETREEKEDRA